MIEYYYMEVWPYIKIGLFISFEVATTIIGALLILNWMADMIVRQFGISKDMLIAYREYLKRKNNHHGG